MSEELNKYLSENFTRVECVEEDLGSNKPRFHVVFENAQGRWRWFDKSMSTARSRLAESIKTSEMLDKWHKEQQKPLQRFKRFLRQL